MATVLLAVIALVGGVALLGYAADQFVIGAARVALLRRVPPLVVGALIIGFGTSAPEIMVSGFAAADGELEIAVGNLVGSNLANLSLVLGVGAMLVPLRVDSRTVLREAPLAVVAIAAFALAVQGSGISAVEAVLLLVLMAGALRVLTLRQADDPLGAEAEELADAGAHRLVPEVVRTALGLAGTLGGAQLLLWGAVGLADRAGLDEGFIGVTMVALGTSLPELVTVIQSARRRETDLIVGNLLGSNVFNALAGGGLIGLIGSGSIDAPQLTTLASLAAVASAGLALVMMRTAHTVTRREGVLLVVGYGAVLPFLA